NRSRGRTGRGSTHGSCRSPWARCGCREGFGQDPPGQVEVPEGMLPARLVWALGRAPRGGQAPLLLQADVLADELLLLVVGIIVAGREPAQEVAGVPACREDAADDPEIGDCGRVDIEDRQPPGAPERDQIEAVEVAAAADHVDAVAAVRRDA